MKNKITKILLVSLLTVSSVPFLRDVPQVKAEELTQSSSNLDIFNSELLEPGKSSDESTTSSKESTTSSEESTTSSEDNTQTSETMDTKTSEVSQEKMGKAITDELAKNGTGITAKNITETLADIQKYNGDTEAIKQMILDDTNATAQGLSDGVLIDVTDKIQVTDLGGLETVSSNAFQEFHVKLAVSSSDAGTEVDLIGEVVVTIGNVAKVSTWKELNDAIRSTTVTVIDVQNNITNTINGVGRAEIGIANRPDFKLIGNGYSIDFLGASYLWSNDYTRSHNMIIENINLYSSSYKGPISTGDHTGDPSVLIYRNVNFTGSQLGSSYQATMVFEGNNTITSKANRYISYDGTTRIMSDTDQAGLEAQTIIFAEDTETTIEVDNGDGVILGAYLSNELPVAKMQPSLTVSENANVTIRTLGSTGETKNWNVTGGIDSFAAVAIHRNGKIDVEKNGILNVETATGTTRGAVRLAVADNTSWSSSINLSENSKLNIDTGGPIRLDGNSRAGVFLGASSAINIGNHAQMNINSSNMTTGRPVIFMGSKSNFNVAQSGSLTVNKNGGNGNFVSLLTNNSAANRSYFKVEDGGVVKFTSTGESTSTDAMVQAGNYTSFTVGNKAIFESKIINGSGQRNMLAFGTNATFSFSDAAKVDLDARGNANANLISMANPGTFNASIQEVSAWNKADGDQTNPSFNWNPMYDMTINYNGTATKSVSGKSVTNSIQQNFINNYRTENFSRVLYTGIPDITVGFEQPSDNKELESSKKLTGTADKGAAMLFYLVTNENDPSTDVLLSTPAVTSPVDGDNRKFHTIADQNGQFSFQLPEEVTLKAGQKIKAYAWLNGKENTAIQTVADKTPPKGDSVTYQTALNEATPTPDKFVKKPTDTNPVPQNFTYTFNAETPQATVDSFMGQLGEHTVKIDLSDEAGNITTVTSTIVVNEAKEKISGTDFSVSINNLKGLSESELEKYILGHSQPEAYKLENGEKVDLSEFVKVTDLGNLKDIENLQQGSYTVTLAVNAADSGLPTDLSTTITVTVLGEEAKLTVEFLNEANQVLSGYTETIDTQVGDKIDLTKDEQVKNRLTEIEAAGYTIKTRPSNEKEVVIDQPEVTVKYELEGMLQLASVPNEFNFGTLQNNARTQRVENPSFDNQLVVMDTRANRNGWQMTVSLESQMTNEKGEELANALRYVNKGKETVLNQYEQEVLSVNSNEDESNYVVSKTWGTTAKTDGVKLQINASDTVYTGDYSSRIKWNLVVSP